jgi:hypothetical protein
MHARENMQIRGGNAKDPRVMVVDEKPQLEYDGLKGGELAWVLGRRYKAVADGNGGAGVILDELNDSQRYAHQAYAGLGNGVDRMQRLASTGWIEEMIKSRIGKVRVNLHEIALGTDFQGTVDSQISMYKTMLSGSTALHCVDLVRKMVVANRADPVMAKQLASMGRFSQGVFVLELGPFLRGMTTGFAPISVKAIAGFTPGMDVPRNLGDNCVFAAIEAEIRRRNLMDWTPDGVVLSKLESPTDEPHKSIEMDARSAQLFNVAIQGPAITTSWTSDVRDYKLECQPMDKVFICLVADLGWNVDAAMSSPVRKMVGDREAVFTAIENLKTAFEAGNGPAVTGPLKSTLAERVRIAKTQAEAVGTTASGVADPDFIAKYGQVLTKATEVEAFDKDATKTDTERATKRKEYDDATAALRALKEFKVTDSTDEATVMGQIRKLQADLRSGKAFAAKAVLTNFRLMRSTSSHMSNYSNFVIGSDASRCGLKLGRGTYDTSAGTVEGCGEYIVGAWCIGTVIDSAASRSTVGTLVRTAPTSMALNLNVNIEWWSGDRLYKSYMDDSGLTLLRGQNPPGPTPTYSKSVTLPDGSQKRTRADADLDEYVYNADGGFDGSGGGGLTEEEKLAAEAEGFEPGVFDKSAPGASRVRGSTSVPPTSRPRVGSGPGNARRA